MNFTFLTVGKLSKGYLKEGCDDFLKRLKAFGQINMIEVPEVALKNPSPAHIEAAKEKESQNIMQKCPPGFLILCDLDGTQFTSEAFAQKISHVFTYQESHLIFVIGGSHGVSQTLKEKAQLRWSFSSLTFPYQLARLVLLEQVYRALTILNHHPYHK